jgi:acetyltransferase-like isoleucine patch superfamily enzyme
MDVKEFLDYMDSGKNLRIGRNVFFNSGVKIQDQGGVVIEDGALIGHNVVIATINHGMNPARRADIYARQIRFVSVMINADDNRIRKIKCRTEENFYA